MPMNIVSPPSSAFFNMGLFKDDLMFSHILISPYYNKFTVEGTAASRVFFRIVAKAVRMGGHWPDIQPQGQTRPFESPFSQPLIRSVRFMQVEPSRWGSTAPARRVRVSK